MNTHHLLQSRSLYQRLTFSLLLVVMLMLAVVFWWSSQLHKNTDLKAQQKLHLGLAEHLVHDSPLLGKGQYDKAALKNLFHTLMVMGPSFEFYYLDPQGNILNYSADPKKIKRHKVSLEPIQQLIQSADTLPIRGDDPRSDARQKIFSAAPVLQEGQLIGYVYVIIGGEQYDSVVSAVSADSSLRSMALVVGLSVIFLLVSLILLFRYFTRPLRELTTHMQTIQHDPKYQLATEPTYTLDHAAHTQNEINTLNTVFNNLLSQLNNQMEQLHNLDSHRRTLLADLSHDLRTPLASLQGYIETLALHDKTLDAESRQKYVGVALKNAQNLKRLVDQIFELAYLESGQIALHKETFPIGDLLWDVKAKFSLAAQHKGISVSVESDNFDQQVCTDIAKLERILSNLIENAIRHTPDQGHVIISAEHLVYSGSNKLRISVQDNGIGIGKEEIAYIFDARYRAANTVEDKKSHCGLGLAISKKLIQLLDSKIDVYSELGKGTCFSFELVCDPL